MSRQILLVFDKGDMPQKRDAAKYSEVFFYLLYLKRENCMLLMRLQIAFIRLVHLNRCRNEKTIIVEAYTEHLVENISQYLELGDYNENYYVLIKNRYTAAFIATKSMTLKELLQTVCPPKVVVGRNSSISGKLSEILGLIDLFEV